MDTAAAVPRLMKVPEGFGRPGRTKQLTAPLHWCCALATSARRSLPDFLIIGAQKAGTTSLCSYLFQHPDVNAPRRKEIHFFDSPEFSLGPAWYRAHFPRGTQPGITGEASPYYLCHPHVPRRVHELLPHARLIVLLRDPVERALSHYHHQVRHGRERLSFLDAIDAEPTRLGHEFERMIDDENYYSDAYWGFSYMARGRYGEQLERWFEYFPRESMLVLESTALFSTPESVHLQALEFLGLEPRPLARYPKQNAGSYSGLEADEHRRLLREFAPDTDKLEALLNRPVSWSGSLCGP